MTENDSRHENDLRFMEVALKQAQRAYLLGEVPVGAILVQQGEIIGEGFDQPISLTDPTAHAEIVAIRNASKRLQNYRLPDTTLYVTLEPCLMCMGAIIHARIDRIVYGAIDPKGGAVKSLYSIGSDERLNHQVKVTGGAFEKQCGDLLREFFRKRRKEKKNNL